MTFRIGVISDTHGLLRPEAERRLAGVDHIVHGGDIGRPDVIQMPASSVMSSAVNRCRAASNKARRLIERGVVQIISDPDRITSVDKARSAGIRTIGGIVAVEKSAG